MLLHSTSLSFTKTRSCSLALILCSSILLLVFPWQISADQSTATTLYSSFPNAARITALFKPGPCAIEIWLLFMRLIFEVCFRIIAALVSRLNHCDCEVVLFIDTPKPQMIIDILRYTRWLEVVHLHGMRCGFFCPHVQLFVLSALYFR